MLVLAVDTSSVVATCAILEKDRLVAERVLNNKMTHSQTLMPMIEEMMLESQIELNQIDYFAVVTGPGSFTGLRIGVATVKALAHGVQKPVIGVPSMEALAYNLYCAEGIIVPMMDARRDRVFTGIYKWENGELHTIMDQDVLEIDILIEKLKEYDKIWLCGDASIKFKDRFVESLNGRLKFASVSSNMPRASVVGVAAFKRIEENKIQNYLELVPDYLRKSQAEREYDERNNN